jgi:hypothetical protein
MSAADATIGRCDALTAARNARRSRRAAHARPRGRRLIPFCFKRGTSAGASRARAFEDAFFVFEGLRALPRPR